MWRNDIDEFDVENFLIIYFTMESKDNSNFITTLDTGDAELAE